MTPGEMRQAVISAKNTLQAADIVANDIAYCLKGRLRNVNSTYILAALKRELRDFNIHTGSWKE